MSASQEGTGSGLNFTPNINKKYGLLLKYNKIINYSFLQNKPSNQLPVSLAKTPPSLGSAK